MKKNFGIYIICWGILLALFNVIAFVTPAAADGEKYAPSFWVGYTGITVAFIGNLFCGYYALKTDDETKLFYRLPLLSLGFAALIATFFCGGLCMLISAIPYWVGVIVCCIIVALYAIAILKAGAAGGMVTDIDKKVKAQTLFIKMLTVDAETLLAGAGTDEAKNACRKVYEAVRYSDPMSDDALSGIESQISLKFNDFSEAVTGGKENIGTLADELTVLIGDRNKRCRLLK